MQTSTELTNLGSCPNYQGSLHQNLSTFGGWRQGHTHLKADDACYFLGEYTARQGFAYSQTNQLVINLKKPIDQQELPEWNFKERAIRQAACAFRKALRPGGVDRLTFVPIPPSRTTGNPLHDNRITKLLNSIRPKPPLDVRELVIQSASAEPVHGMDDRLGPKQIERFYRIDEGHLATELKACVAIVDDVLTTGARFRAAKSVLSARFPEQRFIGLFLARRVPGASGP